MSKDLGSNPSECHNFLFVPLRSFFLFYPGEALEGPFSTGVGNKLNNIDSNNGILISKNTMLYIYYIYMLTTCVIYFFMCKIKMCKFFPACDYNTILPLVICSHLVFFLSNLLGYLSRKIVLQRLAVRKIGVLAPIVLSREPSCDYVAHMNIIWTVSWLKNFILHLTCQGWSAGGSNCVRHCVYYT